MLATAAGAPEKLCATNRCCLNTDTSDRLQDDTTLSQLPTATSTARGRHCRGGWDGIHPSTIPPRSGETVHRGRHRGQEPRLLQVAVGRRGGYTSLTSTGVRCDAVHLWPLAQFMLDPCSRTIELGPRTKPSLGEQCKVSAHAYV